MQVFAALRRVGLDGERPRLFGRFRGMIVCGLKRLRERIGARIQAFNQHFAVFIRGQHLILKAIRAPGQQELRAL